MKPTTEQMNHLAGLIAGGATLTFTAGHGPEGTLPLAAAELLPAGLAWVQLWPESEFDSHLTPADRAEADGPYLNLYRQGKLVGTVAPMEGDEAEQFRWEAWRAKAPELQAFCERMIERLQTV